MKSASTVVVLVGVAALAIGLMYVGRRNQMVVKSQAVEAQWHQVDVDLQRRADLIPNLVEAVKGYMQFERDTLTQVVEARAKAVSAPDQASRMAAENQITAGLGKLLAVMENYPQLKADENVLKLQEELTTTENQLAFARQAYNDVVLELNTRIQTFPSNIIANNFGFHPADYFKGAPEEQAVPKVDLSMTTPRA